MAHITSKAPSRFTLVTGIGTCEKNGHLPRKYGDGIFCNRCDEPVSEEEYLKFTEANPKVAHKRYLNIKGGKPVKSHEHLLSEYVSQDRLKKPIES